MREVELLVAWSYTSEAIKIATFNGVKFLGEVVHNRLDCGRKQEDLMIVKNPAVNISELEKVEIVFKDGVG